MLDPTTRRLDINADLGESYGWYRFGVDAELMGLISSANVACGFHAGDSRTMRTTVELAVEHGVRIGAHMGLPDRLGFGRREIEISGDDAYEYTLHQIGALNAFANRCGVGLQHIKPHGALYMMAARDPEIADGIAHAAFDHAPTTAVYAMPSTALAKAAGSYGLPVVGEYFADRPYVDGQVVMFGWTMEQIGKPEAAAARVEAMLASELAGEIGTVCVHTDTPGAVDMVAAVRQMLVHSGFTITAP
ncbi:MAG: 5-oxoprolinase subunit PxpA [Mycobacterium sp.]